MQTGLVVSPPAGQLAAELVDAFASDRMLAEQLAAAERRLQAANDRLWSGVHPDGLRLVDDGSAAVEVSLGASQIVEAIGEAVRVGGAAADVEAAVLPGLQAVHWAIHRAFCDYRRLGEDRRHLAVEIGELITGMVSELVAAGFSEQEASTADVWALAAAGTHE